MALWQSVELYNISVGDLIRGTTGTYSQKWLVKPGYEDYNDVKTGVVISCGEDEMPRIRTDAGEEVSACLDPGTSGWFSVERYSRPMRACRNY